MWQLGCRWYAVEMGCSERGFKSRRVERIGRMASEADRGFQASRCFAFLNLMMVELRLCWAS